MFFLWQPTFFLFSNCFGQIPPYLLFFVVPYIIAGTISSSVVRTFPLQTHTSFFSTPKDKKITILPSPSSSCSPFDHYCTYPYSLPALLPPPSFPLPLDDPPTLCFLFLITISFQKKKYGEEGHYERKNKTYPVMTPEKIFCCSLYRRIQVYFLYGKKI